MTKVINLYGGPSTGKSTMASHIFAELKWRGINVELVNEFAKGKVWENSLNVLKNQMYIFGKQAHHLWRVAPHVDVIVTDSPILTSIVYSSDDSHLFKTLVKQEYDLYDNIDYFLVRKKPYSPVGRLQTEDDARAIDGVTKKILDALNIKYTIKDGVRDSVFEIVEEVVQYLS